MLRVLVVIAAILIFRALLPRKSRGSPSAISPYMNSLDGLMSDQQVSSALDGVEPFHSWRAGKKHRAHNVFH